MKDIPTLRSPEGALLPTLMRRWLMPLMALLWLISGPAPAAWHDVAGETAERGPGGVLKKVWVVKNNAEIPPGKVAVGVPAKVIADVTPEYKETWTRFKDIYVSLASERYPKGLRRV